MAGMPDGFGSAPRLSKEDYLGPLAADVIVVTRHRRPLFEDEELASACLDSIKRATARFHAQLHAYCLMLDHVHILVEIPGWCVAGGFDPSLQDNLRLRSERSDREVAWQPSYYDNILRREDALEDVAAYIWTNPVTAGIVEEVWDYPWSGPRESEARA